MDLRESIILGFRQLLSNKGRTLLTMMGMFIGVGAVIMILALGEGFKQGTKDFYSDIGLGTFEVSIKESTEDLLITAEDFEVIRSMPEVEAITGIAWRNGEARNHLGEVKQFTLRGDEVAYFTHIKKLDLLVGRVHNEKDQQVAAKVIIVPELFVELILNTKNYKNVLGGTVELIIDTQSESFEIVGVYKTNTPQNASKNHLERVLRNSPSYVPKAALDRITNNSSKTGNATGVVKEGYDQKEVTNQIRLLLNRRHGQKDSYTVSSPADMIDMADNMLNMITLFISAVAGISLIVGGVGIMNIMLVTVKERTREIGVRKALGATNKVILRQFLIEALILTVTAGIIGMIIGYVGSILVGNMYEIQAQLTAGMIIFAVGTSTAIGLLFGVYPAYQAARLDPVDSLRFE